MFQNSALEAQRPQGVNPARRRLPVAQPSMFWRSLLWLSVYRFALLLIVVSSWWLFGRRFGVVSIDVLGFRLITAAYVVVAMLAVLGVHFRRPAFPLQLGMLAGADILYLASFMAFNGGVGSGFGVLLVPYLAAVSLLSRGRMVMVHAAVAVLAVLASELVVAWQRGFHAQDFLHAGFLSTGYFATAWLARSLARYAMESQKLAEERGIDLANLAQFNQLVIQTMPDGVLYADAQGVVRQANQQVERLLGPSRVRAHSSLADYHPKLPELIAAWHEVPECDSALLSGAGGRPVRLRFSPVELNRQAGVLIVIEDAAREQDEAQQMKLAALGRLTASIAHEIRNPLSAIGHAAELIGEDHTDPTVQRLMRIIHDNVFRIEKIVQDVLVLNRRDRAQTEAISLKDYVMSVLQEWQEVCRTGDCGFTVVIPETLKVEFDRGHLHQVLYNLLNNAWRHSSQRAGAVQLHCERGAYGIVLDLIDDGPGVPELLAPRLFEPFFTTEAQGNGLGLYIARELCAANQARLAFMGNRPGAWFRLTFRSAVN